MVWSISSDSKGRARKSTGCGHWSCGRRPCCIPFPPPPEGSLVPTFVASSLASEVLNGISFSLTIKASESHRNVKRLFSKQRKKPVLLQLDRKGEFIEKRGWGDPKDSLCPSLWSPTLPTSAWWPLLASCGEPFGWKEYCISSGEVFC